MIVTEAAASVIAGSTRCRARSRGPPPPYGANIPEAGSQPRRSANTTISTIPSQNEGMLAPNSEATALSRSRSERGHRPRPGGEQGARQPPQPLGQHRPLHPERAAEVAAHDVAEPVHVLDGQRL